MLTEQQLIDNFLIASHGVIQAMKERESSRDYLMRRIEDVYTEAALLNHSLAA